MTGGTTLSAIAVLTNPRAIDTGKGRKNTLFDANLFVSDNYESPSLALLRFFNDDNETFDQEFIYGFIVAHIAKCDPKLPAEYCSSGLEPKDYAYMGDIVQLTMVKDHNAVDPRKKPYLIAYGVVHDSNNERHTFDVDAEQYTVILKANVSCPIHCMIIDSPRWGERKPKPSIGTFITVGGFLDTVVRSGEGEVVQYEMSVDFVNFLGRSTYPTHKRNIEQGTPTPKKTRFQYDAIENTNEQAKPAAVREEEKGPENNEEMSKKGGKGKGRTVPLHN